MSQREREALQRDINAIRAANGESPIGTDGVVGPQTRGALEALGFTADQQEYSELREQALVARNTRQLEISEGEMEAYADEKATIDAALARLSSRSSPEEIDEVMNILMNEVRLESADIEADDQLQGAAENRTERRIVAQYITSSVARMVDEGTITALQASIVVERMLSTQCFGEGGPSHDAIR